MDPNQFYALLAQMHQQGGMFGNQQPQGQQSPIPLPGADEGQHHHGGLSPLMALSPFAGLMASHPKYGLMALSPALGIANLLGAFK